MSVSRNIKVAYGLSEPLPSVFPFPIAAQRDPVGRDRAEIGQVWINVTTDTVFMLTSIVAGVSVWTDFAPAGGAGVFSSLIVNPGPVDLTSTLTTITGTANVPQLIYLHANGGAAETIDIHADQGNGAGSIDIHSDVGGVIVESGSAAANSLLLANANAAGGITVTSGTSGLTETSTGIVTISSAAANLSAIVINATDAATGGINISGAKSIILQTPIDPGNIAIDAGLAAVAGVALQIDASVGIATYTGLTTAAAASQVVTVTCNRALLTSGILCQASNTGGNDAQMTVTRVTPAAGSFTVTVTNNGAASLNGDLIISFIVLN